MRKGTLPRDYSPQTTALYSAYDLAIDRPGFTMAVRRSGEDYETKLVRDDRSSGRYVRMDTVGKLLADGDAKAIAVLNHVAGQHYQSFLKTLDRAAS